ncbi:ATP-dependent DNA helicase [Trichonephila clavipes]|nr:ATP-dependent DNA helicase [Trichonephila clavipes]
MTCNPAWPEITRELIPGQISTDRHDLTIRVFKVKVQKLVALLTKRRRTPEDGGHTLAQKTRGGIQEILVDNSWIVRYSPLLSKMFNCHINVEFCNTQGNVNIDPRDEVQAFRAGRYVNSNEAAWRILGLLCRRYTPTTIHLAVHLPNVESGFTSLRTILEREWPHHLRRH